MLRYHTDNTLGRKVKGALLLILLASSVMASQRPDESHAPLPDYDIRVGYVGFANMNDPRVANEFPTLRNALAALRPSPAKSVAPLTGNRKAEIQSLFASAVEVVLNSDATPSQLFSATTPLTATLPGDAIAGARAFLTEFGSPLYHLDPEQVAALEVVRTQMSPAGTQHVRFQQRFDDVPILGALMQVSLNDANEVLMVGGVAFPELEVSGGRSLSAVEALLKAANHVGPRKIVGREMVPFDSVDWQQVRYVESWTKESLSTAKRAQGPTIMRSSAAAEQKTWITRGPFRQDIETSLVVFPLTPKEGRWAWSASLMKAPTEVYHVVVDAHTGTLLKRTSLVKFDSLEGNVFTENPDESPLTAESYQGTDPATPADKTFVRDPASGLQGNNVVMTQGANEKPETDRDFTYQWSDNWATTGSAALHNFDLDDFNRRFVFTRLSQSRYQVQRRSGSHLPAVGADLGLQDDDSVCGPSPSGFDYFGVFEPVVCVNSNGNVSFNVPATFFLEDATFEFVDAPDGRVMGLWHDFDPSAGGTVSTTSTASTLCVRWDDVPQFGEADSNTFGICLQDDGLITLSYPKDGVAALGGGVGIHPPTRPCLNQGSSSWYPFAGQMDTTGKVGMSRFYPDTRGDTRVSANTVFYHMNSTGHDRQWFNGFDESAGNFQARNYGRGGSQCDPVMATVNPPQFFNNAYFGTPPDGACCPFTSFGKFVGPDRESAVDSDVIVHEFGHGITNRIVGGPGNFLALSGNQSGAMGEGWSDFFAFNFGDAVVGEYSTGNAATGIREVRYNAGNGRSYEQFGNILGPFTLRDFGFTNGTGVIFFNEVHADGEIWASFLQSVRSGLIAAGQTRAEVEALVLEALHFTPSSPTMLDARNALLLADFVVSGGANHCLIWEAAAARGLGQHAAVHDPGYGLPPDMSFSVFGAADRPTVCGGAFELGPEIHHASFESASVGATSANGWKSAGPLSLWHVTDRRASQGSKSFYYGQEGAGHYDAGRSWGRLVSDPLDLTGVDKPVLEFDVAADIEPDGLFDTLWVRVTGLGRSGGSQRAVRALPTSDVFFGTLNPDFVHVQVDLSAIANTTTHRVVMYFDTVDDAFNNFEGVYIDNIVIRDSTQL